MSKLLVALGVALYLIGLLNAQSYSYSYAMMQKLSEEQKEEAIKYGKAGARKEVIEFLREWGVGLGPDQGDAIIITEFLALALAARDYAVRGVELDKFEIEDTLAKSSGKLVFRLTLFGNTEDFAKDYTAVILAGNKTIPATFWDNPIGEAYGDGKAKPAFVTDSDYYFPAVGIDPNSRITLIIQDKNGKAVTQFKFDLSKVR